MRKKLKRISCLLLVVLCMASFSITAFAAETEATESTEPANAETDTEVDYSYVIGEDGSIIITVGGVTSEETVSIGTVVTNGGRLNLRTGAGLDYEIIDQLRPGEEVTVIGTEGDWYEVIVPEKHGYVHSDYLKVLEKAQQNSDIDSAMLQLIMKMIFENMSSTAPGTDTEVDAETGKPIGAFTPDGNLTLIDDFLQIEAIATENTEQKEKQFITLQSKNGNYFYLVIDRTGETENVYFLNLIDEADLMALINGDTVGVPTCSCTDKCVVGSINTVCEVCRSNMSECCGTEKVVEPEPTEPVTEEPDEDTSSTNFLPIIILIIAGGAGGAIYWFKFKKEKPKTKGNSDLDDYDFGEDEDDYDEETEIDDADVMAESEDNG